MAFEQGHALVIGIGSYQYAPSLNVPVTTLDAAAVAQALGDPAACAYPAEQVLLLSEAQATRPGILAALDALAGRTTAGDTVLVFYSGHGSFGSDGYYLTTHDTELEGGRVKPGTGIRDVELLAKLQAIPAQRAILIFNACHAGALSPGDLGGAEQPAGVSLPGALSTALLGTGAGRVIITACRENQKSFFARDAQLTTFTQALTDGLRGRDIESRRGYISVFDLYTYVYDTVTSSVRRRWDEIQEPELTIQRGVGALAVALFGGQDAQVPLGLDDRPPSIRGAAREVDPAESRRMLEQIQHGTVNLAAGRDIAVDTIVGRDQYHAQGDQHIVGGDQIDARNSQGLVNRPIGPVEQVFGEQRRIDTGGGDYAEGNIDKRRGAFVRGGTVYGPVVGENSGEIRSTYQFEGRQPAQQNTSAALRNARRALRTAIDAASDRGDRDLASELDEVELNLSAALDAKAADDRDQLARKLRQATADLARLARGRPELQELLTLLRS